MLIELESFQFDDWLGIAVRFFASLCVPTRMKDPLEREMARTERSEGVFSAE